MPTNGEERGSPEASARLLDLQWEVGQLRDENQRLYAELARLYTLLAQAQQRLSTRA